MLPLKTITHGKLKECQKYLVYRKWTDETEFKIATYTIQDNGKMWIIEEYPEEGFLILKTDLVFKIPKITK